MAKLQLLTLAVRMDDGQEFDVVTRNPDMIRWDKTRAAKKWPTFQDAPFLGMTFVAWAALKREQRTELPWDEFELRCDYVGEVETEDVDPTRPEAGGG